MFKMEIVEVVGWMAVCLTASQFFPQVYKVLKTKSAKDLSWLTFAITSFVTILWIAYGFWNNAVEIIAANSLVHVSCDIILVTKFFTEKRRPKQKVATRS